MQEPRAAKLRTHPAEDSPAFREALDEALANTPAVVIGHAAEDEAPARERLSSNPNAAWSSVEIWLRRGSGIGLPRGLHGTPRKFKSVVLSSFVNDLRHRVALDFGAAGVFNKVGDMEALVAC